MHDFIVPASCKFLRVGLARYGLRHMGSLGRPGWGAVTLERREDVTPQERCDEMRDEMKSWLLFRARF